MRRTVVTLVFFIVASLAACMSVSVSVSAQPATTAPVNTGAMNTTTATPSTAYRGLLRASAIIGKEVRNDQIEIGCQQSAALSIEPGQKP